jgi:peptidoglycan/xylan/chitin deacetylase (PgdA/CDA1 family)
MYHSVSDQDESGLHPYFRTCTTPQVFAAQMAYLHSRGYSTCSLTEAIDYLESGNQTAAKQVVITFDDGYADFYRSAFPVLDGCHFSATVFLPTGYIGDRPLQFKGTDCLTWAEIRELRNCGIIFGSHTVTHPQLSTLEPRAVKNEILESKQTIQDKMGESVDSFAYPYAFPEHNGHFVQMLRTALVEAGYRQGVSTRIGMAHRLEDRYFTRRLPMNSMDDTLLFEAKLRGAYDWLGKFQYGYKFLKGYRSR